MNGSINQHGAEGADQAALNALLAGYAAGSLSPSLHALIGSHLTLRPENRAFVAALEALAAESLTEASDDLERYRGRSRDIFERAVPEAVLPPSDTVFPAPLRALIGQDFADIRWRAKLPGLREYRIPTDDGDEASLLWIKAGRRMPAHTHEGSEATLVLKGGFSDKTGHFTRGDVAVADAELDHVPIADNDMDCICFAVTDAPLRLTGPFGRILHRLLGKH